MSTDQESQVVVEVKPETTTQDDIKYNTTSTVTSTEKNYAVLAHIGGILFSFIPSLIVFLVQEKDGFAKKSSREALNFQINLMLYFFVCWILAFVLIGFLLMPIILIYGIVMPVIAAAKVSKGKQYEYPLIIRLIS